VTPELPVPLSLGNVSRSAVVLRPVYARARPSTAAPVITRVGTLTEEYAPNMVLALESIHDAAWTLWVRVRLPILPNNSTGWVPRSSLGPLRVARTRLVVDRAFFAATLFRDGRAIFRTRVGVGRADWPTPRGEFYVRELLTNFGDPFYGPAAFGTSAKSPVPTGYFAGAFIGIHGTNAPELIPGRISHGCIRLRNEAILRLVKLMPLGTPVTIR
jgi:lipoprotein-anchoring transpeptidase ErfK/SrfK